MTPSQLNTNLLIKDPFVFSQNMDDVGSVFGNLIVDFASRSND